ncbi:hypothetical protein [Deinococcus roseus]|uniref:Uncharacterized protein n=1 Tax=Deinococcus roseus TaxID=392414 RepID=A0ABQ2DGW6_9DEIO|nr:hypothetical protein [Deinococcus roseus]GGJ57608.1 hypothetical protein GCM10008938_49610 [Deinococcus roseus]
MKAVDGCSKVTLQESASQFEHRCQQLLDAVEAGDVERINQHYCPKRRSS